MLSRAQKSLGYLKRCRLHNGFLTTLQKQGRPVFRLSRERLNKQKPAVKSMPQKLREDEHV